MYQFNFCFETFIHEHWQKKPAVIRQGFADFQDPLSADELAGLAMEPEIESRLVSNANEQWQVQHGPFEDYDELGEQHWSLLVQAVDHWHPQAARLMQPFRALPSWRLDDLMVSFSAPFGGVGPHTDQYDVFIVQGSGKRHWRVGERKALREHCPHPDLLQVEAFDAILDVELEPGDILYIPPGFPHEGYALEPSLNYSIGFRAPNQRELLSGFADFALRHELGGTRYQDPQRQLTRATGAIATDDVTQIQQQLRELTEQPELIKQWFGEFISQSRHELDLAPAEPNWSDQELALALHQGVRFERLGGLRAFYLAEDPCQLYIQGERFQLPKLCAEAAFALCDHEQFDMDLLGEHGMLCELITIITALVNQGYWYEAQEKS
ncbi:ribosomal protein uL16 3-hydroxylase [Dongshaea marina]|uniref:ribosomal protein uL16 3-hydroxylase n=1 Tax=Dongshaea marina TaxID=2047966 RepID=UPI000D3E4B06|nr:cupin domain-containing protein [Dongshaea marina]